MLAARCLLVMLVALGFASAAIAEEPLHARIDHLIAAGHPDYAKQAAPLQAERWREWG